MKDIVSELIDGEFASLHVNGNPVPTQSFDMTYPFERVVVVFVSFVGEALSYSPLPIGRPYGISTPISTVSPKRISLFGVARAK
jgi:hypothetical protein